jgi:Predicted nuclease (RecB family)
MNRIEGQLVLSPTDLTKHLACAHVTTLDLAALDDPGSGGAKTADDALNLVFSKGMDHERSYLQCLRDAGRRVSEIPTRFDVTGRIEAEQETLAAMRTGVDVIYQATFYDGHWGGQADFLLRTDRPSDLGEWSYDIADTKLARRLKVPALLQMATYAERLALLQGVHPEFLTVVTAMASSVPGAWPMWRRTPDELEADCVRPSKLDPPPDRCPWLTAPSADGRPVAVTCGRRRTTCRLSPGCAGTSGRPWSMQGS